MITEVKPFMTDNFIVEAAYEQGSTKLGYGDTREAAINDTNLPEDLFGKVTSMKVWIKTDETRRKGKGVHFVYRLEA